MADDQPKDDNFLANNPDDVNPMYAMKQDQKLPEDNSTPFSPPDGVQDRISDIAQPTDTNVDAHERYDAGIEAASGVDLPGQAADEDAAPLP